MGRLQDLSGLRPADGHPAVHGGQQQGPAPGGCEDQGGHGELGQPHLQLVLCW